MTNDNTLVELTSAIVAAYVENNSVPAGELPNLISSTYAAVAGLTYSAAAAVEQVVELKPAVNPKRSVHNEYIVCLEDGKHFKSLKRHLMTHYQLTPEQYREKWSLPATYPMVAPAYALARSTLAKSMGLGQKAGTKVASSKVAAAAVAKSVKRGRKPKKVAEAA